MKNKILVTGGAGMVGSNLVKRLVKDGHHVLVVDNLWRGKLTYLEDDAGVPVIDMDNDFYDIDLSKEFEFDDNLSSVDYIYHLADIVAGIGYVFQNEGYIFRQNFLINSNLITAVRSLASTLKGIVYVGTACSFPEHLQSGVDAAPLREDQQYPASPESAYGWSKLMGEYEMMLLEKETNIPVSVLVLHNVYGYPCDYDPERSQVIPSIIRRAIRYPEDGYDIWGSGKQGRAFVHIDDVVEALVSAIELGLGQGIIQIGPDVCTSIKEIAEVVADISGKNIEIKYDLTKPEGDLGRRADYTKAKSVLGWEPRVDLREGLEGAYKWIEGKMLLD